MRECDLRNSVAVDIPRRAVDRARDIDSEHVSLPPGIFKPREFIQSACKRYQIRFAVVVDIRDDYLITARQIRGDRVLGKCRGTRVGAREAELRCDDCDENQSSEYRVRRAHDFSSTAFLMSVNELGNCTIRRLVFQSVPELEMRLSETISTRDEPLIFAAFGPQISADRRSKPASI